MPVETPPKSGGGSYTTTAPATGINQVPGWIAAQLKSGAISSYTNPNTGQTFTAQSLSNPGITITHPTTTYSAGSTAGGGTPSGGGTTASSATPSKATSPTVASTSDIAAYNALVAKEAAAASGTPFSVSQAEQAGYTVMPYANAPGGYILLRGGQQYNIYGNPIPASLQAPASVAQAYSNAWQSGSTIVQNALPVDYHTFGTNAQITWTNGPHNPEFTLTETLPNGTVFTYSGSVAGVPLGSVLATDQAVELAWQALIGGVQQVNSSPPGTAISVAQGASGLTMNIAPPVAGGSGSSQVITLAPGLTESLPTKITTNGVTEIGTWVNGQFIPTSFTFANGQKTLTINLNPEALAKTGTDPAALAELEAYGYTPTQAASLIQNAGTQPIILSISDTGQITANTGLTTQPGWYGINGNAVYVTNPAYIQNELSSGATVSYLGPQSQFTTQDQAQTYLNGLNAAQQYFSQNPNSYAYIVFNPSYTPTSTTSGAAVLTPQQGIQEASLAAQLGNAGTALSPSQNAALLNSLVASGLTPQQAQQVISSLTPAQIAQLQAGTPYMIYFNTPQGITSSYTPQTTPYSEWQQYAQAQANQQFSPYNTYIAPLLTTLGSDINAAGQWLNTNVAQPIESAYNTYVAPSINVAEQFLNANVMKPVEQFEQGVLNTPLPSLQQLGTLTSMVPQNYNLLSNVFANSQLQKSQVMPTPTQQLQQPTTIGSLLASAEQTYNNALNNYVVQPINNYLINPIERWYYDNYQSPQAQLSHALIAQYINALNAQTQQSANTNPYNLINIALQNALMQEAQNNPIVIGNYGYPGLSPASIEAHLLAIPGAIQDIPAGISHLGGAIEQLITGAPQAELPFNPTGNLVYAGIPQQIQNVNAAVNNSIATANSLPWYYHYPIQIPAELVNYGFLQPAEAVAQGAFNIGNPQATNLQRAEGLASTVSSVAMPAQASLYGLGSGAINVGTNYLFGGQQTPEQAMRSGYQFGAATAPLFEGAQLLGTAASKAIFPIENQYADILDLVRSGELKSATPEEINAFIDSIKAQNPAITKAQLLQAIENYIVQHSEGTSAAYSLDAMANPYLNAVKGFARLGIRTAPVSALFGGINTIPSYLAGNRNPAQLLEDFAIGYLAGTAFQTLLPAAFDALNHLKAGIINFNDPLTINLELRGTPYISEEAHLYYPMEINTPEGRLPARFLLSTTQKIQTLADLAKQINSAAETLNIDPQQIYDQLKYSYINHATPSDFADAVAKTGKKIVPPDSAKVGDALRKAFNDLQGLYSAPSTAYGVPQIYNYLGVRPALTENLESNMAGSNKIGIITQVMSKDDYDNFLNFVKEANANGAGISLKDVKATTENLRSDLQALKKIKFDTPEAQQAAYIDLLNKPKYANLRTLYTAYNLHAIYNDMPVIDSIRQAFLQSGETELVTPTKYTLRPLFDIARQVPMSYHLISTEPNVGVFEGTPFENILPTTRFGAQTIATAIAPELTDAQRNQINEALKNYKYQQPTAESTQEAALNNIPEAEGISTPSSASSSAYYKNIISPLSNLLTASVASAFPNSANSFASPSLSSSPSASLSLYPSTSPTPSTAISSSVSASPSPSLSISPSPSTSVSSSVSPASSISSISASPSPSSSISPSTSLSTSPSPSPSPSSSLSTSPSPSPSPSSSYSYLYSPIRKYEPLPYYPSMPYWYSYPQPTISQASLLPIQPIYSPSLLPVILPGLEPIAEASYSPLTALTTMRPLKAPSGAAPLLPQPFTGSTSVETTITNPEGVPNPTRPATQPPIAAVSPQLSQTAFNPVVSTIPDPATLTYFTSLAQSLGNTAPLAMPLGTLSQNLQPIANAQQALYSAQPSALTRFMNANPNILSITNPNINSGMLLNQLLSRRLPNTPSLNNLLSLNLPRFSSTAPPIANAASFATFNPNASSINGRILLPTGPQLASVLGYQKLLEYLNQVDPAKFSALFIQYAPRSAILNAINNLSYNDIIAVMDLLPVIYRMQAYMVAGIPPGEALSLAESASTLYGLGVPPIATLPEKKRLPISVQAPTQTNKNVAYA